MVEPYHVALVPLSQGGFAIVDFDDYERVKLHNWRASKTSQSTTYAVTDVKEPGRLKSNGRHQFFQSLHMHRLITSAPSQRYVDHKNLNGLDNRKANLRVCSSSQNQMNKRRSRTKRHGQYKGVYFREKEQKWEARIWVGGRSVALGYFANEADGARAYNAAALKYFGEFARLNEIELPSIVSDTAMVNMAAVTTGNPPPLKP
jgi:hypothetical protein